MTGAGGGSRPWRQTGGPLSLARGRALYPRGSSAKDGESHHRGNEQQGEQDAGNRQAGAGAAPLIPLLVEAAATLLEEMLFPIVHAVRGLDEF